LGTETGYECINTNLIFEFGHEEKNWEVETRWWFHS